MVTGLYLPKTFAGRPFLRYFSTARVNMSRSLGVGRRARLSSSGDKGGLSKSSSRLLFSLLIANPFLSTGWPGTDHSDTLPSNCEDNKNNTSQNPPDQPVARFGIRRVFQIINQDLVRIRKCL